MMPGILHGQEVQDEQNGKGMAVAICVLIVWCSPVFSETTTVTSEGKYVMGDLDSKKDAKTLAILEAKRMALEKAGACCQP